MADSPPSRPVIMVVAEDPNTRKRMSEAIERRFADGYRVLDVDIPSEATKLANELRDAEDDVALVIAEQSMKVESGTAVLAQIREVLPTSRRVVFAGWGDASAAPTIIRASLLGDIDNVVGWPWSISDEQFLASLGEILADWATEHGRYVEAVKLVAEPGDAEAQALRDTLVRSHIPLGFYDTGSHLGRKLAQELRSGEQLPAIFLPNGRILSRPSVADVAAGFGANANLSEPFDVVIVGSGPAGLAASVTSLAEGLRTLVVERSAIGGQASSSPQIRNYLGFPGGISGAGLMSRASQQAWWFGAEFLLGRSAVGLEDNAGENIVELDDGSKARTRSVVLAMGVTYRKIGIASVDALIGRGVFYGAGATEAPGVADADVFVVGGANSAAESAVHLARYARHVTMLVRGDSLEGTSEYLVQQLRDRRNIEILLNTEIAEARGRNRLASLVLRNKTDGTEVERDARAVFLLIGATPRTDWLPQSLERDERGFVLTGDNVHAANRGSQPTLGTSAPGVFAAGDVRYGSIKRVAAAVGEGATAIREINDYLRGSETAVAAAAR